MNAPAKVIEAASSLDEMHERREILLAKKAELAKLRDKLSGCDEELELASKEATRFSEHEAELVDKWMDGGAIGPKPTADFRQMLKLEARRLAAAAACDHARNARSSLDAKEAEINRDLVMLHGEIEAESARYMGFSFGELGREAAELRQRLDAIGSELLAGRAVFKALAEKSYDDTGKRDDLPADQHLVITPGGHYLTLAQFKAHLADQRARAHKYEQLTDFERTYGMHA